MFTQLFNKKQAEVFRKKLRNKSTPAEAVLWRSLKNRQLEGKRFRRQYSIGNYILDFYCQEEKLAIELDGAHHFTEEGIKYDKIREEYLNSIGIRILRFENAAVFNFHESVLDTIKNNFRINKK